MRKVLSVAGRRQPVGRSGSHSKAARAGLLACIWSALAAPTALAQQTGKDHQPNPCPPYMEVLCGERQDPGGGAFPGLDCDCGPGGWIRMPASSSLLQEPSAPEESASGVAFNYTFNWTRTAQAQPTSASASVQFSGRSWFGNAGSLAKGAMASFSTVEREIWSGSLPACPRDVMLAAGGGAGLSIGVTTSADAGCSAGAASGASGSCSSRGNANADLDQRTIQGAAMFNSGSNSVAIDGNFGAVIDVLTPSIEGSFNADTSWEVHGTGSATGTASFAVRPDRTYCAFTNRAITRRCRGNVVVSGAGSVASNGSCAASASASVSMHVD